MSIESRSKQYGSIFGDWHIEKFLGAGSGGKSAVFSLYRDNNGWREYSAMKVVSLIEERGREETMPEFRKHEYSTVVREQRLSAEQEVQLMDQLRGKTNIVDYLDHRFFNWSDDTGFGVDLLIRMEKLTDLRSRLQEGRLYGEEEIARIGVDICRALTICHGKNILHRDIKPENIFFNEDMDYKLGDFGIARIMDVSTFRASTGIGTPQYWAPEQVSGSYDARVDIYSLGLVLYELGNRNRLPFAATSYVREMEIQKRMLGTPLPAPCAVSERLAAVILKACAYRPEDRYQSAEEFSRGLEAVLRQHDRSDARGSYEKVALFREQASAGRNSDTPTGDVYATVAAGDPYTTGNPPARKQPSVVPQGAEKNDRSLDERIARLGVIVPTVMAVLLAIVLVIVLCGPGKDRDETPADNEPVAQTTLPPATQIPATQAPATEPPETEPVETEPTERRLTESHPYYSCYDPYTEFVLPDSGSRYYTPAEVKNLSLKQLEVALAEIRARHGEAPDNPEIADYFSYLSWYQPDGQSYALSVPEACNECLLRTQIHKRNGTLDLLTNRFMRYYDPNEPYFLDSHQRYLTSEDLEPLKIDALSLALNEIFARRGWIFGTDDQNVTELMEYFYCTDWYTPRYAPDEFLWSVLSDEDRVNMELLKLYERLYYYNGPNAGNPYIRYKPDSEWIFSWSSVDNLISYDLEYLSPEELYIARNEIYARHGLAFTDENLYHYFLECSWYHVEVAPAYANRIQLNEMEKRNLAMIDEYLDACGWKP